MKIKKIVKPESIEEAYALYSEKKSYRLIGGGAFLRLGKATIMNAIDLDCLDLQYINETEGFIEIGSMTTLRDMETNELLKKHFSGIMSKCTMDIVGVQLRNIATIGGTVAGRYGFSDILTSLLCLDTRVVLHNLGEVSLEEFLKLDRVPRDIITKIKIKKGEVLASFQMMRNSVSDYAILNCAVSKTNGKYKVVVGATPFRARVAYSVTEILNESHNIDKAIEIENFVKDIPFRDDFRASKQYREDIVGVLVKRAIMEIETLV